MNTKNAFSLKGEVALVTGGGSGLGLGIARAFVDAGAKVVLVGRRHNVLEAAVRQLGRAASYEVHDVTQLEEAGVLIETIRKRVGPVSILVNNAGIHLKKTAINTEPREFNDMMQTHVVAAFSLSRAVLPAMVKNKHGNVIFISSMAAMFGVPKVVAYSAAKAAYLGMVYSLAAEMSPEGIRVNAIAPGWIESDMLRKALAGDKKRSQKIISRTPMNMFGKSEDIGLAAVYLCSPAAKFVTGVLLPIDGGASIGF